MASIAGDSNISQPDLGSTKSSHKNNVQNPAKRLKHDHLDNVLQKYLKLRNYNYKVFEFYNCKYKYFDVKLL